jgi:hypothetical protein
MRGDTSDLPVRVMRKGKWQFSLLTLLLFAAAASCLASYIFAAIGIALEHGRRKAATKRAGSSEDCEVSK